VAVTASKTGAFHSKLARNIAIATGKTTALDFALTPLAPNLALQATAASSSNYQNLTTYNAAKANDGDLTTRWNSDAGDVSGSWLEMDWKTPQTFSEV
ncbi:discoidin domain-containing protein, partial [Salmonella sp. NW378]|uniref:hypothetical protein n=1 Tax=Salmonella sp. NW378 TaxID=2947938 RepID=UPI003F42E6DC